MEDLNIYFYFGYIANVQLLFWGEARKAAGTVRKLWKNRNLGVEAKMMYEGVVVPTALYGAEKCGLREAERKKWDVF